MLKKFSHIEVLPLRSSTDYEFPQETGQNFQENALLKAEHAAKHFKKWVLADDSGLVVPALNGHPGIFSRRYAGLNATDADNRRKLLQEMRHLQTSEERAAYYECCLAVANPEGFKKIFTGTCEGYIALREKGSHGFGYDSLFIKHDYDKTFGELDEGIKNRVSHRRKAFERLATFLETLKP
jgi:XTP/dITP diphosphohydrolase